MGTAAHDLGSLIDLMRVQRMCESLSAAFDISLAVLDPDGKVLIASGWQDICTRYHREHPETVQGCLESDLRINQRLIEGLGDSEHYAYRCANGLWDVAFPLIVDDEHLANIYTGQFFFDDDEIDPEVFAQRARRLGFSEREYMNAFARVPVISHDQLRKIVVFLADFVGLLSEMGLTALMRQREHEELRESERRYRHLFDNAAAGVVVFRRVPAQAPDGDLEVVDLNPAQVARTHHGRAGVVGRRMSDHDGHDPRLRAYFALIADCVKAGAPLSRELHVPEEDAYELLTAYPAGRDLWALTTADVTDARRAEQLKRRQEDELRQAYVDVLDAVTGGKLILLTEQGLADELGEPLSERVPFGAPAEVAAARRQVLEAAERRYPGRVDRSSIVTPVSEALDNALKHAHGGTYQVFSRNGCLQVAVSDGGPGIDFHTLPKATLVRGYSTAASLGMGFTIMLQLCERVLLCTHPGHTEVVLEVAMDREPAVCDPTLFDC